jgi:hypothetical protein
MPAPVAPRLAPTAAHAPHHHHHAAAPATAAATKFPALAPVDFSSPSPAPRSNAGTLAISTKPPCNISIDGSPTGLTTPQREIELAPGAHKVTLTNSAQGISRTSQVVIVADRATRVIRDFTH